jgi:hypothetical protein
MNRKKSGKLARDRGRRLQRLIEDSNRVYAHAGLAFIYPIETGIKGVIQGRPIYKEPVPGDFMGVMADSRAVLVECKVRADALFTNKKRKRKVFNARKALEEHQWDAMKIFLTAEAVACVVLETQDETGLEAYYSIFSDVDLTIGVIGDEAEERNRIPWIHDPDLDLRFLDYLRLFDV